MILLDSKPIRNTKGEQLSDPELIKYSLKMINKHREEKRTAPLINGKFIKWLEEANEYIDKRPPHLTEKAALQEFKDKTLLQNIDFDILAKNTEKANAKAEKKGEFNSKIMKKVKGVCK